MIEQQTLTIKRKGPSKAVKTASCFPIAKSCPQYRAYQANQSRNSIDPFYNQYSWPGINIKTRGCVNSLTWPEPCRMLINSF